jgi:MYXO-CTERM domain-containing protein
MSKRLNRILSASCGLISIGALGGGQLVWGQISTGSFAGSQTGAFLSVDINGGLSTDGKPTEGFNEDYTTPAFTADTYGTTWAGWGGSNTSASQSYGDGTVWPQNQGSQAGTASFATSAPANPFNTGTYTGGSTLVNNVNYFQKTLPPSSPTASSSQTITVAISAPGTTGEYNPNGYFISSRDRGPINGDPATNQNMPADTDIDMFRDFIFGYSSGSDVQGENFLQVQFSGLKPNATYSVELYAYDETSSNKESYTATPPTVSNGILGWWAASPQGNNTFSPPADEQVNTWQSGGNTLPGGPGFLNIHASAAGTASVYTWGGDGQADQNASNSYLNGFQIGVVGDTNGDGVVNSADYNTLMANYGTTVTYNGSNPATSAGGPSVGDFNNDGIVNADDVALFMLGAAEFGGSNSPAPEPAGAALIGLAALAMSIRSRRRQ